MKQATNEVSVNLPLFVWLPSLINFRGVFCYKNHAQEANEKGASFDDIVILIVVFINQKRLTLREPLFLLVEKMAPITLSSIVLYLYVNSGQSSI